MVQESYPIEVQLMKFGFVYLGKRCVVRQGSRYIIYLPSDQKDLWRKLQGRKLRVWVRLEGMNKLQTQNAAFTKR